MSLITSVRMSACLHVHCSPWAVLFSDLHACLVCKRSDARQDACAQAARRAGAGCSLCAVPGRAGGVRELGRG